MQDSIANWHCYDNMDMFNIPLGPIMWLKSTPAWKSDDIHYKVLGEICYPFPNVNGATVEVKEWISNFISTLQDLWLYITGEL